jgi:uncharacterized membrane protein YhaH (DUF805 family)
MDLVVQVITNKYFEFSGRARRKEAWLFTLFYYILIIIGVILDISFDLFSEEWGLGTFSLIVSVALMSPSIAVGVRRLHDIDKTGWWCLLLLIPIIGAIALLVMFCIKGTDGPNRFGEDPLPNVGTSAAKHNDAVETYNDIEITKDGDEFVAGGKNFKTLDKAKTYIDNFLS